jgi:hypothetical protein
VEESRLARGASLKMSRPEYFLSTTGLNQSNPARQFCFVGSRYEATELLSVSR